MAKESWLACLFQKYGSYSVMIQTLLNCELLFVIFKGL